MLTALVFDGAGTAQLPPADPRSILAPVTDRLRWKTGCEVVRVPWAASLMGVGGNTPWPQASSEAVSWAADYIKRNDGRFILVGFSAGCRPARELLEQHPHLKPRVAAIAQLADPWQPANRQQNGIPDGPGYGVMGQKLGPAPSKTYWCGSPTDPICRAAPDSLLRYLTASVDALPGGLVLAFLDKAVRGRLQLVPFLGLPIWEWFAGLGARIDRSIREARAYLYDGEHTSAYLTPHRTPDGKTDSLAHRLADTVSWRIHNP